TLVLSAKLKVETPRNSATAATERDHMTATPGAANGSLPDSVPLRDGEREHPSRRFDGVGGEVVAGDADCRVHEVHLTSSPGPAGGRRTRRAWQYTDRPARRRSPGPGG